MADSVPYIRLRSRTLPPPPRMPTIREIILEVAHRHGLTEAEMLSANKHREYTRARQEAYYRCIRETGKSSVLIGRMFGDRDHVTILKGAQKYARLNGVKW